MIDLSTLKDGEEISPSFLASDTDANNGGGPDLSQVPDGADVPLTAPMVKQLISSDPWFPISREHAKILYEDSKKKSYLQKAGEAAEAVPQGLSQLGSQVMAAHNEVKDVPFFGPGFAERNTKAGNTLAEAAAEGGLNTAGLARRAGLNVWDWLKEVATGNSDDQNVNDWLHELQLKQKVERQASGLPDQRPANYDPSQPSYVFNWQTKPYPNAAKVLSLPLDPSFMVGAGAVGKLAKLGEAAARTVPILSKGLDALEAAKGLPGAMAQKVLQAGETVGGKVSEAAAVPMEKLKAAVEGVLPESAKGAVESISHVVGVPSIAAAIGGHGGPVTAAVALLKGTEYAGQFISDTSAFLRHLAETQGDSAVSRLAQLAENPNVHQWISNAAGKLDALHIGDVARFAGDLGESAAHGAATGGVLAAAAGDDPQEVGRAIGAGAGLGVAGRSARKLLGSDAMARRVMATVGARRRFLQYVTDAPQQGGLGMTVDQAAQIDNFTAATAGHARDIFGADKLNFQFTEPGTQIPGGEPGASAGFDPATRTITIRLGDNTGRILHELPHAILNAVGVDGEARMMIDNTFTPDEIQARGREYVSKLIGSQDPAAIDAKVKELTDAWKGDKWIYDEIYADAGYGGFLKGAQKSGAHFLQDALGVNQSIWTRLGDRARATFLNSTGDFFDEDGNPTVPKGAIFSDPEVYNNPQLRKLVYEHLRKVNRQGTELKQSRDEAAPVAIPARQVGRIPAAPKPMLVENGMFVENARGELQPAPKLAAKLDREKSKQMQAEVAKLPVRPKGDTSPEVAPRVSATGEKEITGSKIGDLLNKLPAYGDWAKKVAAMAEGLMGTGKAMRVWYFPVGTSEGGIWRRSVARNAGDLPAKQIDLAPFEFRIDSKAHALVTGLSISAAERKTMRWKQEGKLDQLWSGDGEAFRQDLMTYLQNHAQGKAGSEGIGDAKRNVLNAFVVGKQVRLADLNPLRAALNGSDRDGIIRSLRLDRISSNEPSPHEGWQAEYAKKKINFSPGANGLHGYGGGMPEPNTEQRDWKDWQTALAQERDAARPLAPAKPQQKEFDFVDEVTNPVKAKKAGGTVDPNTGVVTFMTNARQLDAQREAIRTRATYQAARDSMQEWMRWKYPTETSGMDPQDLDHMLAKNAAGSQGARNAAGAIESMLRMDDDAFGEWVSDLPEGIQNSFAKLRELVPLMDDSKLLHIYRDRAFLGSPYQVLAQGSEGAVIAVRGKPWVYKIFGVDEDEHQGLTLSNVQDDTGHGDGSGYMLDVTRGNLVDTINKLGRQSRLPGMLPVEVQGITADGELVVKMPRMSRDATPQEVERWIAKHGRPEQTQPGEDNIAIWQATTDQPFVRDENGNWYSLADVREVRGKFPNLMTDKQGRTFATDVMIRPIDLDDLKRNYDLRQYKPENPSKILYSPEVEDAQKPLITENDDEAALNEKRRLTRREAVALGRKYPEAVPVKLDKTGKVEKVDYGLLNSELVKRHGEDKAALFLGTRLAREISKAVKDPAIAEAVGWYRNFRDNLQRVYGTNALMLSQLLAATSARTGVRDNFKIAEEALRRYSTGEYDGLLSRFAQFLKEGGKEKDWTELPLKANGAKFNANSRQVLRVLFGNWAEKAGQKTSAFAENLTAEQAPATVDVWASRTLRRMLYQPETKQWRILPMLEKAPNDKDFTFAQKAMAQAGKRLGLDPEDVQSVLWFAEKDLWENGRKLPNGEQDKRFPGGWTRGAGAEKSSFQQEFSKQLGNEQPGDLPGLGTTPQEPIRMQAGVTDYRTEQTYDPKEHRIEGANIRKFLGKLPGLMASRVENTVGVYDGGQEPSFDAEFTVRNPRSADKAEQFIYERGTKAHEQTDTMVSRVCDASHPNARPGVEVLFSKPMTIEQLKADLLPKVVAAGIYGMTPAMDRQGRVIGFRTQFVPEISARFSEGADREKFLDPAQCRAMATEWADNNRKKLILSLDPKTVRYAKPEYYDTRVFGKEEQTYPARPGQTSYGTELARRKAALLTPPPVVKGE